MGAVYKRNYFVDLGRVIGLGRVFFDESGTPGYPEPWLSLTRWQPGNPGVLLYQEIGSWRGYVYVGRRLVHSVELERSVIGSWRGSV